MFFFSPLVSSQNDSQDAQCNDLPLSRLSVLLTNRIRKWEKKYSYKMRICTFGIYMFSGDCIKSFQLQDDMFCLVEEVACYHWRCTTFQSRKVFPDGYTEITSKRCILYAGKIWRLECQQIRLVTTSQLNGEYSLAEFISIRLHSNWHFSRSNWWTRLEVQHPMIFEVNRSGSVHSSFRMSNFVFA